MVTLRPQELDDAARRRFVKRLYIPLPEKEGRKQIVENLMAKQTNELDQNDLDDIAERTEGYSGADMTNLCREAALGPIRSLDTSTMSITTIDVDEVTLLPLNTSSHVRPQINHLIFYLISRFGPFSITILWTPCNK